MTGEVLLEVTGLTRRFGGVAALDHLTFGVHDGETRCIIGPNGAGKTTFLNVVCGLVRPTSGTVTFDGHTMSRVSPSRMAHRGMVRSFQTPTVFPGLPIELNLQLGARRPGAPDGWSDRVETMLVELGMEDRRRMPARDLSHGEKKRLEIGMMIAGAPRLLLLDEPTAGMSIRETDEIVEMLRRLCGGMTVVIIEHDMSFVRQIADGVSVFHRGSLLVEGSLEEIKADKRVQDVYLGSGVD
jgi:ABC-type uncharacterized transport system ATPase subunit